MKFTYYGHASFGVTVAGKHLLFDPFITPYDKAKHIDIKQIKADYILVTHGHGDHIADVVPIAEHTGATVIGTPEVLNWLKKKSDLKKTHEMNFGSADFEFGRVSFVPATHSSGLPDGSYGGNPGGYVIVSEEGSFYFAGDTALSMDMQLIPHYAKVNFAVLPIGGNYTMDARDAVKASDFIGCNKIVGVHYDTFPVISIDKEQAKSLFRMAEKELLLPDIGESIDL